MPAKSLQDALRAGGALSEAACLAGGPHKARRCFSTTPARLAGHAIAFSPTSSPQLDELLATIRTQIFLPSYLSEEQRKRVYSPKWEAKLRADPITLEIDGEVVRFAHVDRVRELESGRRVVRRAVEAMRAREDFDNLPRLLEGLHAAGRRLRPEDYAKIVRQAGLRGYVYTVIECARMVRRTGLRLDSSEKANEVLQAVQMKAADADWDEAETRRALAWAEMVVDMLEDKAHQPRDEKATARAFPLSLDPQVLAARLHLAAALAARHHEGGRDVDGKVARYAAELADLWPAGGVGLRGLHPPEAYASPGAEMHYLLDHSKFVAMAAPLLHGLDEAIVVLEASGQPELAARLRPVRSALEAEVDVDLQEPPNNRPEGSRGRDVYDTLFGTRKAASEE